MRPAAGLIIALVLACALGSFACDEEPPSVVDRPLLAGPFRGHVALSAETRRALPMPAASISPDATAYFYWFHRDAPGRTVTFTVRAETVGALEQGSVIHEERSEVPAGASHEQGNVSFHPSQLNRGGARRTADGQLEWLAGLYSLTASLDGEELGQVLFSVSE